MLTRAQGEQKTSGAMGAASAAAAAAGPGQGDGRGRAEVAEAPAMRSVRPSKSRARSGMGQITNSRSKKLDTKARNKQKGGEEGGAGERPARGAEQRDKRSPTVRLGRDGQGWARRARVCSGRIGLSSFAREARKCAKVLWFRVLPWWEGRATRSWHSWGRVRTRGGRIRTQRRRSRAVICAWLYLLCCKKSFLFPLTLN